MNSITKLKNLFETSPECTGITFNWIKKCVSTFSNPKPVKVKQKKVKRKSIVCKSWIDHKKNFSLANALVWTGVEKPSFAMIDFFFKYKSFCFFSRESMNKLLHLYLAVDFIQNDCPQIRDLWSTYVPAYKTDQQQTKRNEFIELAKDPCYPFSHFSHQFFPSSPTTKIPINGSCNIVNVPIQTQWYKKVYQKGLTGCVLYTGFDTKVFLVTHVYDVLHEESLTDSTVTFYDAWILLPQKKIVDLGDALTEKNKEGFIWSRKHEVTFLSTTRVILVKLSTNVRCYALTYPDTSKVDLKIFLAKAICKLKGLLASETLAMITKEKPPTFRSLFRGLSPIPFSSISKQESKVEQEV